MARLLLLCVSTSALLLSHVALAVSAQATATDPLASSPDDEFLAAADSLRQAIAERCAPAAEKTLGGEKLGFGLPPGHRVSGLETDQNSNLMLQVDHALKRSKKHPEL